MPNYKQLNQRNPACNHERNEELRALYTGSEQIEARYPKLIPQHHRERRERYEERLKQAEYRNYVGPIIDFFASMLFVASPAIKAKRKGTAVDDPGDYWSGLQEDADGGGTDLSAFFKDVLLDAMQTRVGWVRVRSPESNGEDPLDLAEYQKRKLGDCWLEDIDDGGILDWETSDNGRLLWAMTHEKESRRTSADGDRSTIIETWEWLTPQAVTVYQLTYQADKPPNDNTQVPQIGAPKPHKFGAVPLVCLDLPRGLWVADRLRSPQLAHLRKQSALNWSLVATAHATPVINVEDPAAFQSAVAGPGYEMVLGKDEKYGWAAPTGVPFDAYDREIATTKDEIFRIAHQMALGVQNNKAAIGRTAESKAADMESTRVVLAAFSDLVKETIEYTLGLIATARGGADADLEWSVEGLDDFAALDVDKFLNQRAIIKDKIGAIPSKTLEIYLNKRTAEMMARDMDEETKAKVDQEITDGTTDPAVDAQDERDAFLLATKGAVSPTSAAAGGTPPVAAPAADSGGRKSAGGQKPLGGKPGSNGRPASPPR